MRRNQSAKSSFRLALAATLVASVATSLSRASAADWTPKAPPTIYDPSAGPNAVARTDYIPTVCTAPTDLDCVESVAAEVNNTWVQGVYQQAVSDGPASGTHWKVAGLRHKDNSDDLYVFHFNNYTGNFFLTTRIRSKLSGQTETNFQNDLKLRVVIRTSWVLPTYTAGAVSSARSVSEKLSTSGASRVTMEGVPEVATIVNDQTTLTSPTGKSANETREFSVTVSDGRFYPLKKTCVEKPTLTLGHDGFGPTLPKFEKANLDLNIKAPHFLSDGVTENAGFFEAIIPIETASCLWGFEVTEKTEFGVSVFETEGTKKDAKTSIKITKDDVIVTAKDFTFSAPTVRVNAIAPSAATTVPITSVDSSTSTSSTTTTLPVIIKSVKTSVNRGVITATFSHTKKTTYKAVAKTTKSSKTLKCTTKGTKVTCLSTRLSRGVWTVSITPTTSGRKGATISKRIRVS